jgi:CRP-like cAMP-binding protein
MLQNEKKMYERLKKISLFNSLSVEELKDFLPEERIFLRHYITGNIIAFTGDAIDSLYCLTQGELRGEMLDFSGRSFTVDHIKSPDTVASAFLFASENTFPVNVVALTPCELIIIPREFLLFMLKANPDFTGNIIRNISDRTVLLAKKIQMLSFRTIRQKIIGYLLSIRKEGKMDIRLPISHQRMAELFNAERPSVSRVMSQLHDEGLIEVKGKSVRLLDIEGLNHILHE